MFPRRLKGQKGFGYRCQARLCVRESCEKTVRGLPRAVPQKRGPGQGPGAGGRARRRGGGGDGNSTGLVRQTGSRTCAVRLKSMSGSTRYRVLDKCQAPKDISRWET